MVFSPRCLANWVRSDQFAVYSLSLPTFLTILSIIALAAGCSGSSTESGPRFASAQQVEINFRGQPFVLGNNDRVALVRKASWPADHYLKLPFWLGTNVPLPGVTAPRVGHYYVISESVMVRKADLPGEWLIDAGSSLFKKETIFATSRTHYRSLGRILPTIVQYTGDRDFTNAQGRIVALPVLTEVSLPMQWTLSGKTPAIYAKFDVH